MNTSEGPDSGKVDWDDVEQTRRGPMRKIWGHVCELWAMVRDPGAAKSSKAAALAALVYLVSPIDAVPDFIPVAGLLDDAAVIMAAVAAMEAQLMRYRNQRA